MSGMTDYLENKLVDALFRGQAYSFPGAVYVGLLTAAPSDSSGGSEATGGSYARVKAAAGASSALTDWKSTQNDNSASTGTTGTTTNSASVTFPTPSASWGAITHFAVYDASSGGNMLFYGALGSTKNVNNGDPAPSFAIGALSVQLDN